MTEAYRSECEVRHMLFLVESKGSRGMSWWVNTYRPLLVKHRGEEAAAEICRLMNIERGKK